MVFDLPLEQLREYHPPRDEPHGFDDFWSKTLTEARRYELAARAGETFQTHEKIRFVQSLCAREPAQVING